MTTPLHQPETEAAYEAAFREDWPHVFRFALAMTNDWTAAEDLAQDAFLRLWRQRERIDWERPVLPWLLVATRNLAVDRFRSIRRRFSPPNRPYLDPGILDRWIDVRDAMKTLTPVQRSALVLTCVDGLSTEDAGRALGITPGAIRAAVSRARQRLEE